MFAAMAHWLNGNEAGVERWRAETLRRNPDFTQARATAIIPADNAEFSRLVQEAAEALNFPS